MTGTNQAVQLPGTDVLASLAVALENMDDASSISDLGGRFVFVNAVWTEVFGYSKAEVIGQSLSIIAAPGGEVITTEMIRAAPGERWEGEVLRTRKNGQVFLDRLTVTLLRDKQGEVIGRVGVARQALGRSQTQEKVKPQQGANDATLAELGRFVSSSLDVREVCQRAEQEIRRLIACDRLAIWTFDDRHDTATNLYESGTVIGGISAGTVMRVAGTPSEVIIHARLRILAQDEPIQTFAAKFPSIPAVAAVGLRSLMAVPMISNNRVIGFLALGAARPSAFAERELTLAERAAAQVASAIANAQLHAALQRESNERETRAEIGRIISSSLKIDEVYDRFADQVSKLIPFDRIVVTLVDLDKGTLTNAYADGLSVPGWSLNETRPLAGTPMEAVARSREGLISASDAPEASRHDMGDQSPAAAVGLRSMLAVPLASRNKVIGVLSLRSTGQNAYGQREMELAQRIGDQVAGAIASAQLHLELERQAREREVLAEIGRIVSSSLNINEVYERFAEAAHKLIHFDGAMITVVDLAHGTVTAPFSSPREVPGRRMGEPIPLAGSITEAIMRRKSGLLLQGIEEEQAAKSLPGLVPFFRAGYRSFISVPLASKDSFIGILGLAAFAANAYTKRDLELAERVALQIAGAITSAELYAALKRTEEALRESNERFDLAVQGSSEGLWDKRFSPHLDWFAPELETYYSPRFKQLLGYEDHEFPNTLGSWESHVHPDDLERVMGLVREHLENGTPLDTEYRLRTRSGEYRWFSASGQAVWDEAGRPVRTVGSLRDITERKHLEEQLRQAQKMEAIGQLAGGVAHDFNNLLSAITSYTELAMMRLPEDSRVHGYLQEVQKACERAANLTRQLLTFSRRQIIEPRVLRLNDLILDMGKLLRRLIKEDIALLTLPAIDLGMVKVDPGQMEQVLVNLVVNARDAMPRGGKLTIETANVTVDGQSGGQRLSAPPGEYVMLAVSDTGTGMSEEVQAHIFEPFFTTKPLGQGTGLGLSTCYGIVAQNRGYITFETRLNHGTTFKIYLPRVSEPASLLPLRDDAGYLPIGNETVLLVEDEPQVRLVAALVLRQQGYNVLEAVNGADALRIARERAGLHIDLLLTDMVMPEIGGKELADQLRALHPEARVLFTSGYTHDAISRDGVLEPGTEFMQKPFTPKILAHKVRDVLEK